MALDQLNFKEIKKIDPLIQKDVLKILKIENSINSKKSYGGTSLQNVVKMLKKLKKNLNEKNFNYLNLSVILFSACGKKDHRSTRRNLE